MLKFNSFKLNKNQRYNYTPRYYKGKSEGNMYDFESKFQKYKDTTNKNDFGSHWAEARAQSRTRANRSFNGRVLIIAAILVLIFLYILDFDLSIFSQPY